MSQREKEAEIGGGIGNQQRPLRLRPMPKCKSSDSMRNAD